MRQTVPCPDAGAYRRLAGGLTPPPAAEHLLAHLAGCAACARLVGTLEEPDPLADWIRQAGAEEYRPPPAVVARLIDELSRLRPDAPGGHPDHPDPVPTRSWPVGGADPSARFDWLAPAEVDGELGRLGPYRILQVLGAGGGGIVFRAHDTHLDRVVALKTMQPPLARRADARQRFLREARAAAAVRHDHVVSIYQVGEDRGVPFLAMELLDGESLDARLEREGKLPVAEVLRVGREVARGLAAAHGAGLVHRDIKPSNVWLEAGTGRVKLLDFGLARASWDDGKLTAEGVILGTPEYMAPEQAQGQRVGPRGDLFSLGCVLYRMATGVKPFRGADLVSTLLAVSTHTPPPPSAVAPDLPPALSDLIMGLLAKDPQERPGSAQAVAQTLEQMANPPAAVESPAKLARRPRTPVATAAALLLAGLVFLGVAGTLLLRTKDGTIVLEGLPADAEVLVDGAAAKVTFGRDRETVEVHVAPGERKLTVQAAGFVAQTQDVVLVTGERKPIRIRLEPLPAEPRPAEPGAVPPPAEGYVPLFDGKQLIGVEQDGNPKAEWKVEQGVLIGRWPPFLPAPGGSQLYTRRKDYQNFRFRVETTLCENWACSMVFGWQNEVVPKTWYRVAIGSASGRDLLATGTLKRSLSGGVLAEPHPPVALAGGEWFTQEVVVEGKLIRVYVNGVLRTRYEAAEPPGPGHVGIALAGQSSIRIRKLEVMELPPLAPGPGPRGAPRP